MRNYYDWHWYTQCKNLSTLSQFSLWLWPKWSINLLKAIPRAYSRFTISSKFNNSQWMTPSPTNLWDSLEHLHCGLCKCRTSFHEGHIICFDLFSFFLSGYTSLLHTWLLKRAVWMSRDNLFKIPQNIEWWNNPFYLFIFSSFTKWKTLLRYTE